MSVYTLKQSKYITLGLIIALGIFLIFLLKDLLPAILGAFVLYALFKSFYMYLTVKLKFPNALGAAIIIILTFIIIIIPFLGVSWMIIDKVNYYSQNPKFINDIIANLESFMGKSLNNPDIIQDAVKNAGSYAVGMFSTAVDFALSLILTIGIMYFLLYFMFTQHTMFEQTIIKYAPFREKNAHHFAQELKNSTLSNVVGQGIIAVIQGGFVALGFFLFGIPDPFFWGVISMFLSFLPVIGSPVIWIPAAILEIVSGNTFAGVGLIVYGLVIVINIDNVVRLIINKKISNTHPIITIVGIVIGLPMFGILGLVYGPLLLSFFILLIKLYEGAFADKTHSEKEKIVNIEMPKEE